MIGYYWDTLGWVHFRLGHFIEAESYLSAAWNLQQASIEAGHLGQVYEQEGKTSAALRMYGLALAASATEKQTGEDDLTETRKRFAKLSAESKSAAPVDIRHADLNRNNLNKMRLVVLPRFTAARGSAEFFLLFAPGPKVEDLKFISGSENQKSAIKVLKSAKFPVIFPPDSAARLLRRVTVMCAPVTGCQALLLNPEDVHSTQ
jgi:hypothetical protein